MNMPLDNQESKSKTLREELVTIRKAVSGMEKAQSRSLAWSEEASNGVVERWAGLPLSVLLGLPAFFATVVPLLFSLAGRGSKLTPEFLAVVFHTFLLAFFVLPLVLLVLRAASVTLRWMMVVLVSAPLTILGIGYFSFFWAGLVGTLILWTLVAVTLWRSRWRQVTWLRQLRPRRAGATSARRSPLVLTAQNGGAFTGLLLIAIAGSIYLWWFSWLTAPATIEVLGLRRLLIEADSVYNSAASRYRLESVYLPTMSAFIVDSDGLTSEHNKRLRALVAAAGAWSDTIERTRDSSPEFFRTRFDRAAGQYRQSVTSHVQSENLAPAKGAEQRYSREPMRQTLLARLMSTTPSSTADLAKLRRDLDDLEWERSLYIRQATEQREELTSLTRLQLHQLGEVHNQTLRFAQHQLGDLFTRAKWSGLLLFAVALLCLGAFYMSLFPSSPQKLAPHQRKQRSTFIFAFALICILGVPLLKPIEPEKLNPVDPLSVLRQPTWYLPAAVVPGVFAASAGSGPTTGPGTPVVGPRAVVVPPDSPGVVGDLPVLAELRLEVEALRAIRQGLDPNADDPLVRESRIDAAVRNALSTWSADQTSPVAQIQKELRTLNRAIEGDSTP